MKRSNVLLVTGLSGGGRSSFLRSLEDIGYHCSDHLPIALVPAIIENLTKQNNARGKGLAIGIDVRSAGEAHDLVALRESLRPHVDLSVVFVTAAEGVVLRRYSETRRRHPVLMTAKMSLKDAISKERKILKPIREISDIFVDTSHWSPHNLARYVEMHFSKPGEERSLAVNITSFGFKKGVARPLDTLFDVRFLANPYFDPGLRDLTGQNPKIKKFIEADPKWPVFFEKLLSYVQTTIPFYFEEGKHYLHIGIGCTGGHHRSVFCAEKLADSIKKIKDVPVSISVEHRDLSPQK